MNTMIATDSGELTDNISVALAQIAGACAISGTAPRIDFRPTPSSYWDAKIIPAGKSNLGDIAEALRRFRYVKKIKIKKPHVLLRFEDDFIAQQIISCERSTNAKSLETEFLGSRIVVQFIDPNATKAFHLGHLYEAVLGNATACLLETLGADVQRLCFVSDISRSVCEAIAGWEAFSNGKTPLELREKPDHMVGQLYSEYTRRYYQKRPDELNDDDPVRRETGIVGDEADLLMKQYQMGDPSTVALWRRIRDWVIEGQVETLKNLNVGIDVFQYGSDTDSTIQGLIERGISCGVLERELSGSIIFRSGKKEYETVVLTRDDGFPTEHARQIGQIVGMLEVCRDLDHYYTFMGMEWKPAWTLYEDILRGIGESPYHDIVEPVCHGMVMVEGSRMKSSQGAVIHADQLLAEIRTLDRVRKLTAEASGRIAPEAVAEIVIKSFFLDRPLTKDFVFSWDQLLDPTVNLGWQIAGAWCSMNSSQATMGPSDSALDVSRTILLQEQDFSRVLVRAATQMDPTLVVRLLHRIAQAYGAQPRDEQLTLLAKGVMGRAMSSIGIAH